MFSFVFLSNYFKILIFFMLLSLISFAMLLISSKISSFFFQDKEKMSEYECGFEPFDSATRQPFDIHFYVVGLLFLIFDVEMALLFPWALNIKVLSIMAFWNAIFFMLLLMAGLFYEWNLGILNWPYEDF